MLAIGCVQAQKCHTDRCPTGVTTQNPWLARGLDPGLKSVRCANYIRTLRRDLLKLAEATGVEHPALIGTSAVEILTGLSEATPLNEVYGYDLAWGFPSAADRAEIARLMTATAPQGGSATQGDASAPVAASTAATTG
jgi:Conserved region in glutamate synthase